MCKICYVNFSHKCYVEEERKSNSCTPYRLFVTVCKALLTLMPITVAARSEAWALISRTLGSNPAQGMDVCQRLYVLCCPVWVEALRRADHSSKEPYQMSKISCEIPSM
jgi:hypothetical protein